MTAERDNNRKSSKGGSEEDQCQTYTFHKEDQCQTYTFHIPGVPHLPQAAE